LKDSNRILIGRNTYSLKLEYILGNLQKLILKYSALIK
jgi:hypothetical protein